MMTVDIKVNGQVIERLTIINRGPTSDAERADPEGERTYEWTSLREGTNGFVIHQRRDGAVALVESVASCARWQQITAERRATYQDIKPMIICTRCNGSGVLEVDACPDCNGEGTRRPL